MGYNFSYSDHSGTIGTGGAAQVLMAENRIRRWILIQNHSTTAKLWVNFGVTAVQSQPSIMIGPGVSWEPPIVDARAISIIGPTTGQSFTAKEA